MKDEKYETTCKLVMIGWVGIVLTTLAVAIYENIF
jgi:hypothetical protein